MEDFKEINLEITSEVTNKNLLINLSWNFVRNLRVMLVEAE